MNNLPESKYTQKFLEYKANIIGVGKRFDAYVNAQPKPALIYHYTKAAGLKGILSSGTLWLSDIFRLNDPSELRHGVDRGLNLIKAMPILENTKTKNTFGQEVSRRIDENLESLMNSFICSFSCTRNDIGQWRSYADDGHGYALGFSTAEIEQAFVSNSSVYCGAFSVLYDDKLLSEAQENLAAPARALINSILIDPDLTDAEMDLIVHILFELTNRMLAISMLFKHEAYKSEAEFRFLEMHPAGEVLVKHRGKSDSLVRYREFDWKAKAPTSLKHIIIGPAADLKAASQHANECMQSFGIEGAQLLSSGIPYRTELRDR